MAIEAGQFLHGAQQALAMGPYGLILALFYLLFRERGARRIAENVEDKQRVELGIQMLEAASTEIKRLQTELTDARVWGEVVAHLAEAERHLRAMISADHDELVRAKREATAFLRRMERLREIRGEARQEVQIRASTDRMKGA